MNIKKILESHKLWLEGNGEGKQADLRGADLRDEDLRDEDLSRAILRDVDLREGYLGGAILKGADLTGTYLYKADLRNTILREADLSGANLTGAFLIEADLSGANLRWTDLSRANLRGANLKGIKGKKIYTYQGSHDFAYYCDGYIKIGCITLPIQDWLTQYEQIGKKEGYSDEEIAEYGTWITCIKITCIKLRGKW